MRPLSCLITLLLVVSTLSELKILSTPDGDMGPEPCSLICSGVSSYKDVDNSWINLGNGKAAKPNIMKGCEFARRPVVTATVRGPNHNSDCPSIRIWSIEKEDFNVLTVMDASARYMKSNECDVYWVATGFTC